MSVFKNLLLKHLSSEVHNILCAFFYLCYFLIHFVMFDVITLKIHGTTHYHSIRNLMTRRINFSSRHRKESKDVVIFLFCSEVLQGFGQRCLRNRIMKECSGFPVNITFSEEHVFLVFLIFQSGHFCYKKAP
jgi:hypothetical protein